MMRRNVEVDHYQTLRVAQDATAHEIRRAYRRLARQHHPDHNPEPYGAEQFAVLARAYEILGDPAKRAHYDRTRRRPALSARPPSAGPAREAQQLVRRGILELSVPEARHLARCPLTLIDAHGRAIMLPAGVGHGDEITLPYDGSRVIFTIEVQRNSCQSPTEIY